MNFAYDSFLNMKKPFFSGRVGNHGRGGKRNGCSSPTSLLGSLAIRRTQASRHNKQEATLIPTDLGHCLLCHEHCEEDKRASAEEYMCAKERSSVPRVFASRTVQNSREG